MNLRLLGLAAIGMTMVTTDARAAIIWEKLPSDPVLPVMRGHASAVHDGKIYVGGRYWSSTETYRFDGTSWSSGPALPAARRNTQFIVYDNELLCVGGTDSSGYVVSTVWKLAGSDWVPHSTGYSGLAVPGLAVLGDTLYSVGGYVSGYSTTVQRYNKGGTWEVLTNDALPTGHATWQSIATFNDRIYVTGVGDGGAGVYSYDGTGTAGSRWRAEPSLPSGMAMDEHSTLVFGSRLYTIGGLNVFSLGIGDTEWRLETNLPASVYRGGAVAYNESIYVIGGSAAGGTGETNDVYRAIPEPASMTIIGLGLAGIMLRRRMLAHRLPMGPRRT